MGAQLSGILCFAGAAADRDGLETHRPRELHPEVAEPADTEYRHPVSGQRLGVTQRVVDRGARRSPWARLPRR